MGEGPFGPVGRADRVRDALPQPGLVVRMRCGGEDREVPALDLARAGDDLLERSSRVIVTLRFVQGLLDVDHRVGHIAGREEGRDQRRTAVARDHRRPRAHLRDETGEDLGLVADRLLHGQIQHRHRVLVGETGRHRPPRRPVVGGVVQQQDRAAVGAPALTVPFAIGVLEEVFELQRRHGGAPVGSRTVLGAGHGTAPPHPLRCTEGGITPVSAVTGPRGPGPPSGVARLRRLRTRPSGGTRRRRLVRRGSTHRGPRSGNIATAAMRPCLSRCRRRGR